MLDRVIGEVPLRVPDPKRWQQQLHDAMVDMHRVLTAHRDIARVAIGEIPTGPRTLVVIDRMLGIMRAGRLPERVIRSGSSSADGAAGVDPSGPGRSTRISPSADASSQAMSAA